MKEAIVRDEGYVMTIQMLNIKARDRCLSQIMCSQIVELCYCVAVSRSVTIEKVVVVSVPKPPCNDPGI
ncbi:hypothetical protein J1N35_040678 [Gossypium stocksii]|uniref:Uncharacterized protein n=1 Tax=Gossypium stocksii TaxID=47602 RepID=A0A9D3ZHY8_9ROSI|nr:hypothetical protein J1N35_040678 [Gossypium stocksii]